MAKLFAATQIRELAKVVVIPNFQSKIDVVAAWHLDYHSGDLLKDNETSREQAYNSEFFGVVLGYKQKPAARYTFEPKSSTSSGQIPDARIGVFDSQNGVERTVAVVELKGARVPLDRAQRGHANLSPVQQGFKYKPQYRGCEFVIVSNFYELRLYNDNDLDFETWTLDDLADESDDHLNLRCFWLLLNADNFVSPAGQTRTQELVSDIRSNQEKIGRAFYREYSDARQVLISNLWLLNDWTDKDPTKCVEFAQRIIDRMVFVCFAEDRGLLPESTIARVVRDAGSNSFGNLWSTFKSFFDAIDVGSEKLGITIGFNGGLFATDRELDALRVGDNALRAVAALGNYNFVEDLTVSILGQLFEQSISDLEELRARVRTAGNFDLDEMSKRRKNGIYYTPSYVVRAIVNNSLGDLLRAKEQEFLAEAGLSTRLNDVNYSQRQRSAYAKYQTYLHDVQVLDPACGSGAFLVDAFDFLLAENERVNSILGLDIFSHQEFVQLILQNNLFGVDLNEESVEITKLSLWLKSASKGHKLTTLDANIRFGNSLIEPPAEDYPAAFDWKAGFPSAMENGGFDVVIGNPPYVRSHVMVETNPVERGEIVRRFETARGNWDLFVPFYQRAFDLTKTHGYCSMIVPNKILSAPYASELREYVGSRGALERIIDVSQDSVFDVDIYPVIVTAIPGRDDAPVRTRRGLTGADTEVIPMAHAPSDWTHFIGDVGPDHAGADLVKFDEIFDVSAAAAVNEAYEFLDKISDSPTSTTYKIINTGTIDPYTNDWGLWPMTYLKHTFRCPAVAATSLDKQKRWHSLEKAVVAGMATTIEAAFSEAEEFLPALSTVVVTAKSGSPINARAALAILNSDPFRVRFIAANRSNAMAGGFMTINSTNLGGSLVPKITESDAARLSELAEEAVDAHRAINELSARLRAILISEFGEDAWSKRMKRWWTMDFARFVRAIRVSLSLSQKSELFDLHRDLTELAIRFAGVADGASVSIDAAVEDLYARDIH